MNNPPSEIEHLQHLVSNLERDLQNALMQSRRRGEELEAKEARIAQAEQNALNLSNQLEERFAGVVAIRCIKHINITQFNKNESSGGECAACEVEKLRQDRDHLDELHRQILQAKNKAQSELNSERAVSKRRSEVIEKCKVVLGSKIDGANFYFWITTEFPETQGNLKLIEWRERQTDALTAIEALEKEGLSNE